MGIEPTVSAMARQRSTRLSYIHIGLRPGLEPGPPAFTSMLPIHTVSTQSSHRKNLGISMLLSVDQHLFGATVVLLERATRLELATINLEG